VEGICEGMLVGITDGTIVGVIEGTKVGIFVGVKVGTRVGINVGRNVGSFVGWKVGVTVGTTLGINDGVNVGMKVGPLVGVFVGYVVGIFVGICVGLLVGKLVGIMEGTWVGTPVGKTVGQSAKKNKIGFNEQWIHGFLPQRENGKVFSYTRANSKILEPDLSGIYGCRSAERASAGYLWLILDTLKCRFYKFYGRTTNSFWGNEDIQIINTKNDYGKNRQKKSQVKKQKPYLTNYKQIQHLWVASLLFPNFLILGRRNMDQYYFHC
jgi:hypothetical protein